jgi:hypothetical protein
MVSLADNDETIEFDYVEQAGPGIPDLGPLPEGDELEGQPQPLDPNLGWEQETVEQFLRGTGAGLHLLIGKGEKAFLMTMEDLGRIGPPLTRILNRYEPTLRASVYADPLLVAHGLGLYGWRSAIQRQNAINATKQDPRDGYQHGPVSRPSDVSLAAEEEEEAERDWDGGTPDFEQGATGRTDDQGRSLDDYTPYADRRRE